MTTRKLNMMLAEGFSSTKEEVIEMDLIPALEGVDENDFSKFDEDDDFDAELKTLMEESTFDDSDVETVEKLSELEMRLVAVQEAGGLSQQAAMFLNIALQKLNHDKPEEIEKSIPGIESFDTPIGSIVATQAGIEGIGAVVKAFDELVVKIIKKIIELSVRFYEFLKSIFTTAGRMLRRLNALHSKATSSDFKKRQAVHTFFSPLPGFNLTESTVPKAVNALKDEISSFVSTLPGAISHMEPIPKAMVLAELHFEETQEALFKKIRSAQKNIASSLFNINLVEGTAPSVSRPLLGGGHFEIPSYSEKSEAMNIDVPKYVRPKKQDVVESVDLESLDQQTLTKAIDGLLKSTENLIKLSKHDKPMKDFTKSCIDAIRRMSSIIDEREESFSPIMRTRAALRVATIRRLALSFQRTTSSYAAHQYSIIRQFANLFAEMV